MEHFQSVQNTFRKPKVPNHAPIFLDLTKYLIAKKQDRTTSYAKIKLFNKPKFEIKSNKIKILRVPNMH